MMNTPLTKMIRIPDEDYDILDAYADKHSLSVETVTHVSGTKKYILHCLARDELVEIVDAKVVLAVGGRMNENCIVSLRATDNLQKDWTIKTKKALLDEVEKLRKHLLFCCDRLNDGSAWADDGEGEFQALCEAAGYER